MFNILKRCLKHRFTLKSCNIQVIFQPHLAQVFWMILKICKRKYQPWNHYMKHHWICMN